MNIIELARKAGLKVGTNISGVMLVGSPTSATGIAHIDIDEMTRFAALVRAQALEEAARMCKKVSSDSGGEQYDWLGKDLAQQCAAAIWALKEKT